MIRSTLLLSLFVLLLSSCNNSTAQTAEVKQKTILKEGLSKAYFASGCFWCVEAVFENVRGVEEAVSGYSGGTKKNPTYKEICTGTLRHAEAVEVYYDPEVVSYETLLKVFFGSQDPTTPNQQGPDRGPQYRSIAFYQTAAEKTQIEAYISELDASGVFDKKIVTEVVAFEVFWPAEEYHQDFEKRNPNQGYVKAVSVPRLLKFESKFPSLLKLKH
ncbi:MAG: peptide-methionine (S)-S-oxide reductase [Polaribacter sp.]|jgi:peptide-methionine (S)-S-oxide reductase